MTASSTQTSRVELHHIDIVDPSERHGRARDLFPVWFSTNMSVGNAVFGALAIFVGNNLFWAVVAVLFGNVVGATFMALHSAQGARLGVPQLIQSRGQFGFYGALLPVALAALLYGGFFVVTAILGGQALSAAAPSISVNEGMILVTVLSVLLALLGYRAIHTAARWAVWPLAAAVVIATIASALHGGLSPLTVAGFKPGAFFSAVGIMATFLLTYAPYVSDYSRYLPVDTPASSAFAATFGGAMISTTWAQLLGVVLAVQVTSGSTFYGVGVVLHNHPLAVIILLVTAIAIGGNNSMNLYGGMLNLLTAVSAFRTVRPSVLTRVVTLLPTLAIGLLIALRASANFDNDLNTFLSFLMLGFVPWGSINLLDFYLIRHGDYDVHAFFDRRGRYFRNPASWTFAGLNVAALTAYAIGILGSLPFVDNAWYAGWVADRWVHADISWVPGIVVTSLVYLGLAKLRDRQVPKDSRLLAPVAVTGASGGPAAP
jgi:purine-cytosine permease-like protein